MCILILLSILLLIAAVVYFIVKKINVMTKMKKRGQAGNNVVAVEQSCFFVLPKAMLV